jgi:hypothetical protein
MKVKPHIKNAIFLVWVLLVPAGSWLTYKTYPPNISGHWLDIFAFLLLTCVVATMPIVINEMFIFLIQWVALATFFKIWFICGNHLCPNRCHCLTAEVKNPPQR